MAEHDFVPLSVPVIDGNAWSYVKDCLDSGWVSSVGGYVTRFEAEFAQVQHAPAAAAVVNGTAALHMALLAAGVRPDEEVLVSTLTFIAPANAIRYVGAHPVFMDADPRYWQMDMEKTADFLARECAFSNGRLVNRATGRRVAAVLPVHALGHPVDMDALMELAERYGLTVVEDASESLGALYKGAPIGRHGALACYSFNGNKVITCGGGGMVTARDARLVERVRYLSTQAKDDPVEYRHGEVGYNCRLTNLQAALGLSQLEGLAWRVADKRRIARRYARALEGAPGLTLMAEAPWAESSFWMYTVLIDEASRGESSRAALRRLHALGVQSRPLWQPLHLSPAHSGSQSYRCDTAERLYRDGLSLPCSPGLDEATQDRVSQAIRQSINH
jgi:perosamine synthetase